MRDARPLLRRRRSLCSPPRRASSTWARRVRDASDESARLALLGAEGGAAPRPRRNGTARATGRGSTSPSSATRCADLPGASTPSASGSSTRRVRRLAVDLRRFTLESADERRVAGELEFHDLLVLARQMLRDPAPRAEVRGRPPRALPPPPHRRVPGHRSHPGRAGGPHRAVHRPTTGRRPSRARRACRVGRHRDPARPPVLRGRPQAVDLPVPPGRHLAVPAGRRPLRRRRPGRVAHHQLPHGRGRRSTSSTTCSATCMHRAGATRACRPSRRTSRSSRCAPMPPSARPWRCSASNRTRRRPYADDLRRREAADVAETVRRVVDERLARRPRARRSAARLAAGPARRHHHPHPHPARRCPPSRTPSRRPASPTGPSPRRSSTAAAWSATSCSRCGPSTTRPTSWRWSPPSARRCSPVATTTSTASAASTAATSTTAALPPAPTTGVDRDRADPRRSPGLTYLRELHHERRWSSTERAHRPGRPRPAGARAGRGRRPRPRPVAAGAVRRRPGPGVDRRHQRHAPPVPGVGPPADRRGHPGRRGRPARDRRRRRAHHDGARRQGPRVPGHDRVRAVDRSPHAAGAPGRGGLAARPAVHHPRRPHGPHRAFEDWQPVDEQMSHDERIRLLYVACTRAQDHLVVSLHRAIRKGGVARRPRPAHQRRAAPHRGWAIAWPSCRPSPRPTTRARSQRPVTPCRPPGDRGRAGTRRPRPRSTSGSASSPPRSPPAGDPARSRRPPSPTTAGPTSLADPGLHKRPRDLDLPPWQKGRYGSAVGRAVHGVLQTDRPGHARRRRASTPRWRRRPRPRASSATRPTSTAGRRGPGVADRRRGGAEPALARGLRRRAARRRPHPRGLRRPALPTGRRPGRRRLQDRAHRPRRRSRPARRPLPRCRVRPTPSPSPRPRANRWSTSSSSS